MSSVNNNLLIGEILQSAGLVQQEQVQKALNFQKKFTKMKLGEILVIQDKIQSKTIDFFVNKWAAIKQKGHQFPIGYYLQQASLLNNQQILEILVEQKDNQLRFGDIVVAKKWLSSDTVEFFLNHLSEHFPQLLSLDQLEKYNQEQLHLEEKYANPSLILTRILAWTGGNPSLSRDICQFFVDNDFNIPSGKEYRVVDQSIENTLIKNWSVNKLAKSIRLVENSLDNNQKISSLKLWQEYREVLLSDSRIYNKTEEQNELINTGLIVQDNSKLRVANLIFIQVFNQDLVVEKINKKQQELENDNKILPKKQYSNSIELKEESNIELGEIQHMSKINDKNNKPSTANFDKENKPLITIWTTFILGTILLLPLLLIANNFSSSTKKDNQLTFVQGNISKTSKTLQQFCEDIDISSSSGRLNLIFKIEQRKKEFLKNNPNNFSDFPDICESTLNEMRILAVPELGKADRTLDAIRILCKISINSEYFTEAEVWLDRWHYSAAWGRETEFYLKEAPHCPAGNHLLNKSSHKDH